MGKSTWDIHGEFKKLIKTKMDMESFSESGMFWGLVLKPEKRYEQVVDEPFHISHACLEPSESDQVTSVYIETDDEEYLLCNLTNKKSNISLDLNFNFGEKIVFKTTGAGVIHLTGYNVLEEGGPEDSMMFDESDDEDSNAEEESEEEAVPMLVNG